MEKFLELMRYCDLRHANKGNKTPNSSSSVAKETISAEDAISVLHQSSMVPLES